MAKIKKTNTLSTNINKIDFQFGKLILFFAFLEGATVMTIEMAASRFIAPTFGSSFTVWVIVLTAMILGLTAGYFYGGIKAAKNQNPEIFKLFLLSGLFVVISPIIANNFIIGFNTNHFLLSIFVSSVLFVLFPMFLLGTISTLLVQINSNESKSNAGVSAGKIYGFSTLGGIIFALLIGYFLIPYIGLKWMCFIVGTLVIILNGIYLLNKENKLFFYIVTIISAVAIISNLSPISKNSDYKIIHHEEGLMGQLLVIDRKASNNTVGEDRVLYVNRMGQTWIDKNTGNTKWSYVNYIISICSLKPNKADVLLLGLGGGTVANYLTKYTQANVDAVEFDERIISIANTYFALDNKVNVTADDARHYINSCKKKYDIIIFDVFKGEVPPHYVLSKESLQKVKNILNPGGFIVVNFNGFIHGEIGFPARCVYATLVDENFVVNILPTPEDESNRNILFVASLTNLNMQNAPIKVAIEGQEKQLPELILSNDSIDLKGVEIIRDDKPFLELINLKAANIWRKSYYESHTKEYTKKGIPLFF